MVRHLPDKRLKKPDDIRLLPIALVNRFLWGLREFVNELKCCIHHISWKIHKSVLGESTSANDEDSEIAYIWKCWKSMKIIKITKLFLLSFGSILFPPMGFFLWFFLKSNSKIVEVAEEFAQNNDKQKERWLFVNGMCVNTNLGKANARQLSKIFQKQIGFLHNPTQGFLFDLMECMVGRTFNYKTPVALRLVSCLREDLSSEKYEKVILIVHSQGGIVASNAINILMNLKIDLRKLEVYTFGSAADEFVQKVDKKTGMSYPFYEHYANKHEYIAKIGTLYWQLPGNVFCNKRLGHFLGEHYLPDFKKGLYRIKIGPEDATSRLYSYIADSSDDNRQDTQIAQKQAKVGQNSNIKMTAYEKAKQYDRMRRMKNLHSLSPADATA